MIPSTVFVPLLMVGALMACLTLVLAFLPKPKKRSMRDPSLQMEAVSKVAFERIAILNRPEQRVFELLEEVCAGTGLRVMAQTSMGELIRPADAQGRARREAQASINSKRLDFAIIGAGGLLQLAVEYHGAGHYQGNAALRDAVKREALKRAGVPMLEIPRGMKPDAVRAELARLLQVEARGEQRTPCPEDRQTEPPLTQA